MAVQRVTDTCRTRFVCNSINRVRPGSLQRRQQKVRHRRRDHRASPALAAVAIVKTREPKPVAMMPPFSRCLRQREKGGRLCPRPRWQGFWWDGHRPATDLDLRGCRRGRARRSAVAGPWTARDVRLSGKGVQTSTTLAECACRSPDRLARSTCRRARSSRS